MRLPGTRYQEPGWEEVRKLLGQCSLAALRAGAPAHPDSDPQARADALERYVEAMAAALHALRRTARAQAPGNAYGDSVFELALSLLFELQARPADWHALCEALDGVDRGGADDGLLRKKVNDMYALLRDRVDADNYQAACGRPCSANRMYAYRMLDTAYGEIARLFADWERHRDQVGAILGRELAGVPIEVRQLRGIGGCRPEWVLRWSATRARFGPGPGPLHTRSKRFASLKDQPERIGAMLAEIGEYQVLSDNRDRDWLQDLDDAAVWMEDYWRVLQESVDAAVPGPDRILEARQDALDADACDADARDPAAAGVDPDDAQADCAAQDGLGAAGDGQALAAAARLEAIALAVALPPGYMQAAAHAEEAGGWVARALRDAGLPVRLAVYARVLGAADDAYPDAWRDPASGELPTMRQLAALAQVSLPTLRKRRDAAIDKLVAIERPAAIEQPGAAPIRRSG
ncbi:hypothetical protein HH212_23895 [Massilia forsythiae]|uniref:Uncharacterized protein n=1 Tax=Massilia forsythiae TaxID=2728020 RepID=A0A7Z2ZUH1_9BURK|nr:hypothetical protein [Massilia forsythiae]QJE02681.1 hypothetical protein HH212_23895 [Massilia forsythiae]